MHSIILLDLDFRAFGFDISYLKALAVLLALVVESSGFVVWDIRSLVPVLVSISLFNAYYYYLKLSQSGIIRHC